VIRDPVKSSIWCFTEKTIFKYVVNDEERNIWRIFLDKGDFVKAQEYSKHDPEKMEVISMKQADHFFAKKKYCV
jgi:alpha/beta superfamily hydrolase